MIRISIFLFVFAFCYSVKAQTPYTQAQFAYDSILNVVYGSDIDYGGNMDTLKLDIFKPVGDANCKRPIMMLLHGGAWAVGNKEDASMKYMSRELAKRGWIVANINYRLGTHKTSDYTMKLFCNSSISEPCAYICDTTEAIRGNFRSMQDAKGAIRFMKSRNLIDSSDINNVFIGGESAGAFTSYSVGFTDKLSEKPSSCYSIADAPTPDTYFANLACTHTPLNFSRPDLGSIEGTLNLGTYDANVKGIASFFGGVFDLNIFQQTDSTPCVYMFCQGSDVIVNYNYGKIFGRIDSECYSAICQPYAFYPNAWGNEGLRQHFVSMGSYAPYYKAEIIDNYALNNNCFVTGHAIDDPQLRLQNMADFFATKIASSGNSPQTNCGSNRISELECISNNIKFQNPCSNNLNIEISTKLIGSKYAISNYFGEILASGFLNSTNSAINLSSLSNGFYLFSIEKGSQKKTYKVIKN
ncbi:MAG: carboxylesterase family protein [Bacteroidota bacterium]